MRLRLRGVVPDEKPLFSYELGDLADDQKSHTTVERYLQILNNRLIPRWGKSPRAGNSAAGCNAVAQGQQARGEA